MWLGLFFLFAYIGAGCFFLSNVFIFCENLIKLFFVLLLCPCLGLSELYTIGGNANGRTCMFPFHYKDQWYSHCTETDSPDGRLWCGVETNYQGELWGYCPTTCEYCLWVIIVRESHRNNALFFVLRYTLISNEVNNVSSQDVKAHITRVSFYWGPTTSSH